MLKLKNKSQNQIKTRKDFHNFIKELNKEQNTAPLTEDYISLLIKKYGKTQSAISYLDQGTHWIGWLEEYKGSGFYNRKNKNRSPEYIYNHIMCPQMLIWLAEVVGVDHKKIKIAMKESLQFSQYQTQCATIRKHISWNEIISNESVMLKY